MAGNSKQGGVKGLLLAHCEKAIALVVVGAAAYLAYAALGVPTEDRQPSSLQGNATSTLASYERNTWSEVSEEDKSIAVPVAPGGLGAITADSYAPDTPGLSRAVVPPTIDRQDPVLLAATDLEASALTGIFAFIDPEVARQKELERARKEEELRKQQEEAREAGRDAAAGPGRGGGAGPPGRGGGAGLDEGVRPLPGRFNEAGVATQGFERFDTLSVACVTAKAPFNEQFEIYRQTLKDARGYSDARDIPQYLGLQAQRAEVRGDGELEWEPVVFGKSRSGRPSTSLSQRSLDRLTEDWLGWPRPLVDSRFEHPVLTMPLPPLVGQDWQANDVVHSDASLEGDAQAEAVADTEQPVGPAAEEGEESEFAAIDPIRGRGGEGEFGRGGPPRRSGFGRTGPGRGPGLGGPGPGGFGRFAGGEEMGERGMPGGARRRGAASPNTIDPAVPFRMVRFFDFSVAPGRRYRYRVRLVLQDVNQAANRTDVAPEVFARLEKKNPRDITLKTQWSEPSRVLSIPMAGDVFVSKAKLPSARQLNAEGSVELLVQSFSLDEERRAIKAAKEESFSRGAVMNMTEDVEVVTGDRRGIKKLSKFEFRTGLTLVDFRGGEELPGDLTAPVAVLLMDSTGKLFVRDELDDAEAIERHKAIFDPKAAGGGRGGGFPGGGRGGGGFDFGGEF